MLALLEEAFAGPAWHGPSLTGALRDLTLAGAGLEIDVRRLVVRVARELACQQRAERARRLTSQL